MSNEIQDLECQSKQLLERMRSAVEPIDSPAHESFQDDAFEPVELQINYLPQKKQKSIAAALAMRVILLLFLSLPLIFTIMHFLNQDESKLIISPP